MKKSSVIPIYKVGDNCKLTKDKEQGNLFNDNKFIYKKGSEVEIIDIELSDSKFAELDEIYLVDYIDMRVWVYQEEITLLTD